MVNPWRVIFSSPAGLGGCDQMDDGAGADDVVWKYEG